MSYARQAYFAVTAFKFAVQTAVSRFGRFRLVPDAGTAFLTPEQAAAQDERLPGRRTVGTAGEGAGRVPGPVQLAEPGDAVADATAVWPDTREGPSSARSP